MTKTEHREFSSDAAIRLAQLKPSKIYPYSKLDNCALCDQTVGRSRQFAMLRYGTNAAIVYRLCGTCAPNAPRGMSDLQLKMIEMNLDVEAEQLGLVTREGKAQ